MSGLSRDPEKQRAWRRRGARNYEDKLREEGRKFSDLDRSTPLSPVSDRRKDELERAYGPEKRREFVTSLPCEACGKRGEDIHQAHIESGGMGRKADADKVAPLCYRHHIALDDELGSVEAFDREFGTDLRAAAERVDEEWRGVRDDE